MFSETQHTKNENDWKCKITAYLANHITTMVPELTLIYTQYPDKVPPCTGSNRWYTCFTWLKLCPRKYINQNIMCLKNKTESLLQIPIIQTWLLHVIHLASDEYFFCIFILLPPCCFQTSLSCSFLSTASLLISLVSLPYHYSPHFVHSVLYNHILY